MAAYAIAQVHVTEENRYAEYLKRVPETLQRFGGRYVVRDGKVDHYGERSPYERIIVIEFPDRATAEQWMQSPEYSDASKYRDGACHGLLSIIDGAEEEAFERHLAERLAWAEGVALHSGLFG